MWLGWCCWLIFRLCNQPKHLFSTGFVLRFSYCVIHADWLPWNYDNGSQPSSFCTQFLVVVFFSATSRMGVCAYVCRCVCLCTEYMVWRGEGDYVILQLISIKMTDYAASNGCGLDLKDSLTRSGWKPQDPLNTTDALLSAVFIVFGKLQFS